MTRLDMVPLACELPSFEARVLAARLGAEGVMWELRGASTVYPVGWVDVLVNADDLDHARELLLVDEVEAAFDDELADELDRDAGAADGARAGARRRARAALVVIGIVICGWFLTFHPW